MKRLITTFIACLTFASISIAGNYFGPTVLIAPVTVDSTVWTNVLSEQFTVTVNTPCVGIYCNLLPCPAPNVENIHATLNFPGKETLDYRFLVNGKVPTCKTPNAVIQEVSGTDLVIKTSDSKGKGVYTVTLQAAKKVNTSPNVVITPGVGVKVHLGVQVLN